MTGRSLALALFLTLVLSCGGDREQTEVRTARIVEVRTVRIEPTDYTLRYETNGHLEAIEKVQVKPLVSGRVKKILVEEGRFVRRGTLLLRIEDRDYVTLYREALWKLKEAQESYRNQLRVYQRRKRLYQKELISREEFEEAKTKLETLRAQIESLKAVVKKREIDLERTKLRAPFDGYVVKRLVSVGELVGPSTVCYEMVRIDLLWFLFKVPQELAHFIKEGTPVEITVGGRRLRSRVGYVSPSADENRMITLKAEVRNGNGELRPGMYGRVSFGYRSTKAFLVPEQAVQLFQGQSFLWIVKDSRAVRVPVRVVGHKEGTLIVLGPLKSGDRVVVENLMFLKEGLRVKER